jgi:hypothetical protein
MHLYVETGAGGSPNPYQTQPNVFLGQQTSVDLVTWSIPFDPPGPFANHVVRITNLRTNASQLPPARPPRYSTGSITTLLLTPFTLIVIGMVAPADAALGTWNLVSARPV